jgi:hypothetical protein
MREVLLALGALLLLAESPAFAQRVDSSGVPYRPWDFDAALGFHLADSADGTAEPSDDFYNEWNPSLAGSFDVGHYWTNHLKTELGVTLLRSYYSSRRDPVTVPGGPGYLYLTDKVRQTQVVLSGTYQFLENTFAHPYITAGARIGMLDVQTRGDGYVQLFASGVYRACQVPPVNDGAIKLLVRPFVAAGSKSYFSERTFVRPELVLGFNASGVSQFGVRLGFGVDF